MSEEDWNDSRLKNGQKGFLTQTQKDYLEKGDDFEEKYPNQRYEIRHAIRERQSAAFKEFEYLDEHPQDWQTEYPKFFGFNEFGPEDIKEANQTLSDRQQTDSIDFNQSVSDDESVTIPVHQQTKEILDAIQAALRETAALITYGQLDEEEKAKVTKEDIATLIEQREYITYDDIIRSALSYASAGSELLLTGLENHPRLANQYSAHDKEFLRSFADAVDRDQLR